MKAVAVIFMYWSIKVVPIVDPRNNVDAFSVHRENTEMNTSTSKWMNTKGVLQHVHAMHPIPFHFDISKLY